MGEHDWFCRECKVVRRSKYTPPDDDCPVCGHDEWGSA